MGRLRNVHLVSIPIFEPQTGEKMMNLLTKLIDSLYENWKYLIVEISTDGDESMTGRIGAVVTMILALLPPGATCIWCGLHQLDLVMQLAYEKVFDKSFFEFSDKAGWLFETTTKLSLSNAA